MSALDEGKVRAEFESWAKSSLGYVDVNLRRWPNGDLMFGPLRSTEAAWIAAAHNYSAAADALRAERDAKQEQLDFLSKELCHVWDMLHAAESALPFGYGLDSDETLADKVRELAEALDRAQRRTPEPAPPAPSPLERARADVVEDAMARHAAIVTGKDVSVANASLARSCIALRALSQPAETDADGELRHALGLVEFGMESDGDRVLTRAECAVVAQSIRNALAAKEKP